MQIWAVNATMVAHCEALCFTNLSLDSLALGNIGNRSSIPQKDSVLVQDRSLVRPQKNAGAILVNIRVHQVMKRLFPGKQFENLS